MEPQSDTTQDRLSTSPWASTTLSVRSATTLALLPPPPRQEVTPSAAPSTLTRYALGFLFFLPLSVLEEVQGGWEAHRLYLQMMDNPFGDHARSSVGTSDFSFRSSHSTNIIPIAYIPPHSNSMSLDDANRGAYGELMHDNPNPERIMGGHRSIPASLASRDSLILAGADQIDLHPLPPVLNPGSPLVPLGASAGGAPIRPPRSPGLDLQLPKGMSPTTSTLHSPTSPSGSGARPPSGFPWSAPPPTAGSGSHFSATTNRTSTNSYLSAPGGGDKSRGMSFLLESHGGPRVTAAQSHLSTMSTATSRSTNSTMSYILDPPQIITPVNAQGLRRVEITGRGQAGLVRLPGNSASGATPPLPSSSTLQTSTASSPTMPKAFVRQQQSSPLAQEDPFSDTARFSVGGIASPATRTRARSDSASTLDDPGYVTESGGYGGQSDSSRWTMSSAGSRMSHAQIIAVSPSNQALAAAAGASSFYDVPHSARSSAVSVGELAYDTGSRARPLTNDSFADSRSSFVSSRSGMTDSMSMLDGISFMQPPTNISAGDLTKPPSSPLFPMPPPRSPSFNAPASPAPSIAASSLAPRSEHRGSQYSYDTSYSDNSLAEAAAAPSGLGLNLPSSSATSLAQVISADDRNTSPLPAPFLPFAGQRPTSNTSTIGPPPPPAISRVLSQAISVRSGFGSGLSQIPFQLGFPSGLDETASERDSFMTASSRDSRQRGGGRRYSNNREAEGDGEDDGMLSGVEEQTEPPESSGYATSTFSRASMQSNHTTATVGVAALRAVGEAEGEGLDPFGEHAEVKEGRGADVRASTDTLALSAELARSFGALGDD